MITWIAFAAVAVLLIVMAWVIGRTRDRADVHEDRLISLSNKVELLTDRAEAAESRIEDFKGTVDAQSWKTLDACKQAEAAKDASATLASRIYSLEADMEKHNRTTGGFWKTARGEQLRVRDMSTGHMRNCIKYIIEVLGRSDDPAIKMFQNEIKRREVDAGWRDLDPKPAPTEKTATIETVVVNNTVPAKEENNLTMAMEIAMELETLRRGIKKYGSKTLVKKLQKAGLPL